MKLDLTEYELVFLIMMLDEMTTYNKRTDSWPGWHILRKMLDGLHIEEALEDLKNGAKGFKK